MILMEHAEHGNLLDYLKEKSPVDEYYFMREHVHGSKHKYRREHRHRHRGFKNVMEDKQLMTFAYQIARGMEHIAAMKVCNNMHYS